MLYQKNLATLALLADGFLSGWNGLKWLSSTRVFSKLFPSYGTLPLDRWLVPTRCLHESQLKCWGLSKRP
jgi:hypothetical protein